jgi:hypothetical protein
VVHSALQVQNQTEEHEIESAMYTQVYMHYGRQEGFFLGGGGVWLRNCIIVWGLFFFGV